MTAIDLSLVPVPAAVDALSYESILTGLKADFVERCRLAGIVYDLSALESDPAVKLLEVAAWATYLVRQTINDKVRAVYLPTALGADLDNLVALANVARITIAEETTDADAVLEADGNLARRYLGTYDLPAAGSIDGYTALALGAYPSARDVAVIRSAAGGGEVHVVLLSDDGADVSNATVAAVLTACNQTHNTPLTDSVAVMGAEVVEYEANIRLTVKRGSNLSAIAALVRAGLAEVVDARFKIGQGVPVSAIEAPGYVTGVLEVTSLSLAVDIEPDPYSAPKCTAYAVTFEEV